jgi:hypothetical protein
MCEYVAKAEEVYGAGGGASQHWLCGGLGIWARGFMITIQMEYYLSSPNS